jgi:hypothetical protein
MNMNIEGIKFSRSPSRGKRNADVKARVTEETKLALQRRCAELGITESDYIDRLLLVSLFGADEVLKMEQEKTEKVMGSWLDWLKRGTK